MKKELIIEARYEGRAGYIRNHSEFMTVITTVSGVSEDTAQYLERVTGGYLQNLPPEAALKRTKGITAARARKLSALRMAVSLRRTEPAPTTILRSSEAFDLLAPEASHLQSECVWAILMNQAGNVLAVEKISVGGVTHAIVDTRIILRKCLEYNATRIILAHNHPSGSPKPSNHDTRLTEKVKQAVQLFDIDLTDHIIIARDRYFSFKDEAII